MKNLLLIIASLIPFCLKAQGPVIEIDYRQQAKPLNNFWNSTGFSPADIIETREMKQVLHDIGRLPAKGMQYIRPHYLLNLAVVKGMETGKPVYDWTQLDQVLDELAHNRLKLIFELMGFPSDGTDKSESQYDKNFQEQLGHRKSYFDNLQSREQLDHWKSFIIALALHLENRYGQEEVRTWFFETTNEPDIPHFWRYDVAAFLNYYDACSEGLKAADPALQFGGPGTARDLSDMFVSLLAHCDTGKNFITGETGVRMDFISFHDKDLPQNMIKRELRIVDFIRKHHARFARTPIINDEADPIVGWATPYWWERSPWYAAFVAQNIDLHQRQVIEAAKVNYRLFSSDHTFLGDWNQRTTHALFRNQSNPEGFVAIRKPVLSVMDLIAQMGDKYVDVKIPKKLSPYFGVIPSIAGDTLMILVYNKTAMEIVKGPKPEPDFEVALMAQQGVQAQLKIKGIKGKTATIKEYRIDEMHGNPHHVWVEMGKPQQLSNDQVAQLKKAEQPALLRSEQVSCSGNKFTYQLTAPSPSVSLITIVPEGAGR